MSEIHFIKNNIDNLNITNDSNNDILDIKHLRLTEKNSISINLSNSQLITNLNVEYLNGMKNTHFIFIDGSTPLILDWEISSNNNIRIINVNDPVDDNDCVNRRTFVDMYNYYNVSPGDTALIGTGYDIDNHVDITSIEYVNINTPSNSQYFSDISTRRMNASVCSNGKHGRCIYSSGYISANHVSINVMDYVEINNPSNSQNFGENLLKGYLATSCSNGSNDKGFIFGGYDKDGSGLKLSTIQYFNFIVFDNANVFGNMLYKLSNINSTSNGKYGIAIICGGINSFNSNINTIQYVHMTDLSNAEYFSDMIYSLSNVGVTSNDINNKALISGGTTGSSTINDIQYVLINSPANAQDFGDMLYNRCQHNSDSNGRGNKAIMYGGTGDNATTDIDYIDMITPGNSSSFGNLALKRYPAFGTASNSAE